MPYTDKGLACVGQKLTFQKFRTGLTLLFKLPYNHCISILSFIYPPKSIEWRACRATTPETRYITIYTRRLHFVIRFVLVFFIIISCSHVRFHKSYRFVFFIFSIHFVGICFVVSTLKTTRQQTTLVKTKLNNHSL